MKDFCRVFYHPTKGQMVALIGTNEFGNPSLSLSVRPPEMGVCSIQMARDNDEPEDFDLIQEALESLTMKLIEGFQEVFDFFGDLGGDDTADNDPKLTIISGNSCISLKTPYLRGRREEGDTSPRVLWFNDENSRETPPSNTHVNDLGAYLGGTVISMAFKLDVDYLQRTASHEHN